MTARAARWQNWTSTESCVSQRVLAPTSTAGVQAAVADAGAEGMSVRAVGSGHSWGKLHTLGAPQLASLYPRFGEFVALRDRLDPGRVFANAYTERVLGR